MSRTTIPLPIIKSVDNNGQISLGKKYAGQQVSLIWVETSSLKDNYYEIVERIENA